MPGQPGWGKPIKCKNPIHTVNADPKLARLSQLSEADLGLRLSDIAPLPGNQAMLDACKQMINRPWGWLYLYGSYGNAKTVALRAVCNHLSMAGYHPVVYIKFSRLVEIIRAARRPNTPNTSSYPKRAGWTRCGTMARLTPMTGS